MESTVAPPECDFPAESIEQPGVLPHKLPSLRPDYLIISPGKTGSTWLANKVRRHPQVFLPGQKELKYFSSFFQSLDLNWYLDQFGSAAGRIKGEASPSYAVLPVQRIRRIRQLMPDVKLIFLMREPISRAWSHAKHCHRFRETNFASCTADFASITDRQWRDNLTHDWPLAHGDYLGQLRRWLSVFPREQFYVGFYESIARRPKSLLRDLFTFLDVDAEVDLSAFNVSERVLVGQAGELSPQLARFVHQLLHERTRELACYLREQFDLEPPSEWDTTLELADDSTSPAAKKWVHPPRQVTVFEREFDDSFLARVLDHEKTTFASIPFLVLEGYCGYNIVCYRRELYALAQTLGPFRLNESNEAELRRFQDSGVCLIAPSLAEVKQARGRASSSLDPGKAGRSTVGADNWPAGRWPAERSHSRPLGGSHEALFQNASMRLTAVVQYRQCHRRSACRRARTVCKRFLGVSW